jgi:hypothetical protein
MIEPVLEKSCIDERIRARVHPRINEGRRHRIEPSFSAYSIANTLLATGIVDALPTLGVHDTARLDAQLNTIYHSLITNHSLPLTPPEERRTINVVANLIISAGS